VHGYILYKILITLFIDILSHRSRVKSDTSVLEESKAKELARWLGAVDIGAGGARRARAGRSRG
jgi:hypothetical protein